MRNALKHFNCSSSQLTDVERSIKLWKLLLCDLYIYICIFLYYISLWYISLTFGQLRLSFCAHYERCARNVRCVALFPSFYLSFLPSFLPSFFPSYCCLSCTLPSLVPFLRWTAVGLGYCGLLWATWWSGL